MPGPNSSGIIHLRTAAGNACVMLAPPVAGPAPTLLLLALSGEETLTLDGHRNTGLLLRWQGWNVVSLDLPCHGADSRAGEAFGLDGWAERLAAGEEIVAPFRARVNDVLAHLVAEGLADPERLAAAGISRGGFMAFQAAAGNPLLRAVAGFAPVTDLRALGEFAVLQDNELVCRQGLINEVEALADRAAWVTIGNADGRVGTDCALAFTRALTRAAVERDLPPRVTLHVLPTPGHHSFPSWHVDAAAWLQRQIELAAMPL
jgi:dienelactone hydrolase